MDRGVESGGLQPMESQGVEHDWAHVQWEPSVQNRELYAVFCGDLKGKEI